MMFPKHGEHRGGERYDRPSFAWVRCDEWLRRHWEREDRIFAKRASQGDLCAPMLISDGTGKDLQSQCSGKWYDSKSELRKDYKRHGCIEVGTDVPTTRFIHGDKPPPDPHKARKQEAAIGKALARVGFPPV